MKLLLGILLALVLIEGMAIVGLYRRQGCGHHALITKAGPPSPVAAPEVPATASEGDQSKRLEELTAKVAAPMK